jgi:hypothetical protein
VLCPDDAPDASLDAVEGVRSLAIPGGRRALDTGRDVAVLYDDECFEACLRLPTFAGGLAVKIAALLDERTSDQVRHHADVAFLLTLIDPAVDGPLLSDADVAALRAVSPLFDSVGAVAWRDVERGDVNNGIAALRFLVG